jgi:glucose/arabinose dehydrogenase/cytochrome c2
MFNDKKFNNKSSLIAVAVAVATLTACQPDAQDAVQTTPVTEAAPAASTAAEPAAPPAVAADIPAPANAGKDFFRAQCALCHSAEPNDGGGAQGPSLQGVFGRAAASTDTFPFTPALRNSGLTWDAATLHRFLESPTTTVPGTAMVVAVPNATERANVIAYFEALANGTFEEPEAPPPFGAGAFGPPPAQEPAGDPEWKQDAPGVVHKIDLTQLPAPLTTPSAVNFPTVIPRPAGADFNVPDGFTVDTFATDVEAPRGMIVADNGDILLVETTAGRIKVMRPSADGSTAEQITVFAQGMLQPLGMAFYPSAANPEWLYVAENNRVVRYPYSTGDTVASALPEVVVSQLAPTSAGHYTRDLAFSPDGTKMYVSVGSASNVAEGLLEPAKTPAEIQSWEAERGLGAAWGGEENRASVLVFDVGNEEASAKLFANGIRNCVGLTVQPETGDVWCSTNERDQLGDDLVPDYSTRVTEGSFFGWPWYYMGDNEDPRHAGARPDLVGKIAQPDVPYRSHSAAVDLEFYPQQPAGASAFPAEYAGQGFAVLHGSWNRAHPTGSKVVHVPIVNGEPTGEYVDFLTGFITDEGRWGRPVAITVAKDGSLLLSDDGANVVYRIAYGE